MEATWTDDPDIKSKTLAVAAMSGLFGFLVGLGNPSWHAFIESSQIGAGIVGYPRENPFYIYQAKSWTVLHQAGAIVLSLGVSEKTLAYLASGLLGMVSLQALALSAFCLSRNVLFSASLPAFILVTRITDFGINYKIELMGYCSYGILGMGLDLIVLSLFALRHYRSGGVLLGLAPALHPILGALLWLCVAAAFAWDRKNFPERLRETIQPFLLGFSITAASAAYHFSTLDIPKVSPEAAAKYLNAYLDNGWDFHRGPVRLFSPNFILAVLGLSIGLFALRAFKDRENDPAVFFPRALIVPGIIGLAACLVSHLPPGAVPAIFLRIMPNRFFNMNVISLVPLLAGLMAYDRKKTGVQVNLSLMLLILFLVLWLRPPHWQTGMILTLFASFAVFAIQTSATVGNRLMAELGGKISPAIPRWIMAAVMLVSVASAIAGAYATWETRKISLRNWKNDPFLAEAAGRQGILLINNIEDRVQLLTRRPILLGILNGLPYTPEAGPAMYEILMEVYELDLFAPPDEVRNRKTNFPLERIKSDWEARTPERWREIKKKYGVTDVLAYADWKLQLPGARYSNWGGKFPEDLTRTEYVLYRIP
ncbi:MAG: hypothetical protein HY579_12095 [Nitrospinae bacterium]|nr:hypothetical protein [Nitrospinota bacterium]